MRILVTGGAGYVGSHTAQRLRQQGHEPVVLDDLSTGHREFARFGPFEYADVRDEARVADVLRRHRIQAVIHFAAKSLQEESQRQPEAYFSTNVGGLVSLLAAMRRAGVQRLVFSSSCAVYRPQARPLSEEAPLGPLSVYGVSKQHAEEVLMRVAPTFGLRYAILRYFNVVGADPSGQLWEWHEPETHVVPRLLGVAARGGTFHLFGTEHPTPDGSAVRDYVDVRDVAQVHLEALEHLE
ncbi:MAG TPA: NAD-dependent epimerase/dehydratase family protein, partial [bacterium]|nr:NAD-dependent epimerase/dehydratase family protein [bacterium]